MREALGSPHIDSRPSRGPGREALVRLAQPEISARVRDIDDAGAILVVGTDPLHSSPILDLRIRKAIRRNGAKLAVATEAPTTLDGGAAAVARYAPGGATAFLAELSGAGQCRCPSSLGDRREESELSSEVDGADSAKRSEGAPALADVLQAAETVVVVWGDRIGREGEGAIDGPARRRPAARPRQQGRLGPARSPRLHQRPRPARGRLPPRRRPGPDATRPPLSTLRRGKWGERREGNRGDPRRAGVRRAEDAPPLRRRPAARLPRHRGLEKGAGGSRPHRRLLHLRDRHHRHGRRRLPAGDPRRERRHGLPPRRPPPARPPERLAPRRHPPELGRPRRAFSRAGPRHRRLVPALSFRRPRRSRPLLRGHHGRRHRRPRHPLAGDLSSRKRA